MRLSVRVWQGREKSSRVPKRNLLECSRPRFYYNERENSLTPVN